jgi:predicted amidohydrolase
MRVAMAQLAPIPGEVDANLATVCEVLAGHRDADLAVFPELFVPGYDPERVGTAALAAADPRFDAVTEMAREAEVAVVFGFAERSHQGIANAMACIDRDGAWVATYRKLLLFGDGERTRFVAGDTLTLAELAGVRVGALVCFDMEFPEPARALARAGAQLLVTIAANMEPYGPDHALAARARALDNRRPHVYVNRVGAEAGLRFVGGSVACEPGGRIVADLGTEAGVACVDVDVDCPPGPDVDYLEQLPAELRVESSTSRPIQGEIR